MKSSKKSMFGPKEKKSSLLEERLAPKLAEMTLKGGYIILQTLNKDNHLVCWKVVPDVVVSKAYVGKKEDGYGYVTFQSVNYVSSKITSKGNLLIRVRRLGGIG